jgi:hypothetical protein
MIRTGAVCQRIDGEGFENRAEGLVLPDGTKIPAYEEASITRFSGGWGYGHSSDEVSYQTGGNNVHNPRRPEERPG